MLELTSQEVIIRHVTEPSPGWSGWLGRRVCHPCLFEFDCRRYFEENKTYGLVRCKHRKRRTAKEKKVTFSRKIRARIACGKSAGPVIEWLRSRIPAEAAGEFSSSLSALILIRCPFHPRVTAVARKTPRSFCQNWGWQVTPKLTYTLDPTKSLKKKKKSK